MKNQFRNVPFVIVDDEPAILFLHELMLNESRLTDEIYSFYDPKAAIDFIVELSKKHLDFIILLDINMPNMNGWELLEKLDELEMPPNVQVVMVTSSIHKADKEKSFSYERVKMYVEKPINLESCQQIGEELLLQ